MAKDLMKQKLSAKQLEVVNYDGNEILIKGIAGSGKTTVLLRRAIKLLNEDPNLKVSIFTYNKTLAKFAKDIVEEIAELKNLKINTFHGWAHNVIYSMGKLRGVIKNQDIKVIINKALKNSPNKDHRFVKDSKYCDFLIEEISWIKGKGLTSETNYLEANRRGRGSNVRITKQDRKLIFFIYQEYEREKDHQRKMDFDDYGVLLYQNRDKIKDEFKYDHVMIDEAQDLQQIQLTLLRSVAKKAFVVAADKGQKIYNTSFSWRDIGINILGGRTKILQNAFRSTKQIIQMAQSLQLHDSLYDDEEFVHPVLPDFSGPIPDVYACSGKQDQDSAILSSIKEIRKEDSLATIGILGRQWKSVYRIYYKLQAEQIPHEFIKSSEGNAHSPGVKLTTFHSTKGLEFDYVIIMDLTDKEYEKDKELQEEEFLETERRLLYVSITRARKYLQLYYHGEPSNLLAEIDGQYYNKHLL